MKKESKNIVINLNINGATELKESAKDTGSKYEMRRVYTFLLENEITTIEYRTFCYLLTRAKRLQKMKAERENQKGHNSAPQSFSEHFACCQECKSQNDDFLDSWESTLRLVRLIKN